MKREGISLIKMVESRFIPATEERSAREKDFLIFSREYLSYLNVDYIKC